MLDERYVLRIINLKQFPFFLGGGLCIFAIICMLTFYAVKRVDLALSIAGIQLLLYLICNGVCSMIVRHLGNYIKKTIIVYVINIVILAIVLFLLKGNLFKEHSEFLPIYEALIFCFFTTLILIAFLRKIISYLND